MSPDLGSTPEGGSSLWGKMLSLAATGVPGAIGPATSWNSLNGDVLVEHLAAAEQDGELTRAGSELLDALEEMNESFSRRQDAILETTSV